MRLLKFITDIVDRDVAANSKPISVIGMLVPFLPFMMFVDGAPADTYPKLGALAFAASLSWGAFVLWRLFRHLRPQLAAFKTLLGAPRFWTLLLGTVFFILFIAIAQVRLSSRLNWPEAYGFNCSGRGCLLDEIYHSPRLLSGGTFLEIALFAVLWIVPAGVAAALLYALIRRWLQSERKPFD